ncbi:MAG: hypothetical protein HOV81_18260 [Kofleriaceae bacterium]|nr:hypothetical protein [Kofleriaceae bacterium]
MRRLVLVLVFGLLAACDDDDGGGGGPIRIEDLTSALQSKYCNVYVQCGLIEDLATCRTLFVDTPVDPDLIAAVNAGKVIYHADQAAECLDGLAGSCDATDAPDEHEPEACDRTFEGTVAEGGQCALDEECISQDCYVPSCPDACCQGTCEPGAITPRPHLGDSCVADTRCVDSYCDEATAICSAYLADGASCTSSEQCTSASCLGTLCRPRAATGEPCGPLAECALIGDTCSQSTTLCAPVGLIGDPCTTYADCSPIYTCDETTNKCTRGAIAGESCAQTFDCYDRSYCDTTTMICTARKADGQPCEADSMCVSDVCDPVSSTCITPPICI